MNIANKIKLGISNAFVLVIFNFSLIPSNFFQNYQFVVQAFGTRLVTCRSTFILLVNECQLLLVLHKNIKKYHAEIRKTVSTVALKIRSYWPRNFYTVWSSSQLDSRDAQNFWVLGLGTQIVLGFLRFWVWVWVLGFKIWVLGGLLCTR